jgi:hypothetical protein
MTEINIPPIISQTKIAEEIQRRLEARRNEDIELEIFIKEMAVSNFDIVRVRAVLDKLSAEGTIYYPVRRYIKII